MPGPGGAEVLKLPAPRSSQEPNTLAEEADAWMHSPGWRHIMRDLYSIASGYVRDWKRTGIPVAIALVYEVERHRIKLVTARAVRLGMVLKDQYGYTLNNNHKAYIARHMMDRRPEWKGLSSGEVGFIEYVHFVDHDTLLLLIGDKRQRRRILRKMKLANTTEHRQGASQGVSND